MSLERLDAIESELGIRKEKPKESEQTNISTPIRVSPSSSKSKSRLDEIEEQLFQNTVTDTSPIRTTFSISAK